MKKSAGKNKDKNKVNSRDEIIIDFKNITKNYGEKRVINDFNLQIKKGEVVALLGKNGAGKTTLFKILLNIASADKGKIEIKGENNERSKIRENISFLGEDYQLYSYLTAEEIIELAAKFYKKYDREWALNKLQEFDIPIAEKVSKFSKGMKQTLRLVQSLANKGEIIILDEPTAGLDVKMQNEITSLIQEINEEGKTVLFSSHNLLEVKKLAKRVVFMKKGEIVAVKDKSFIEQEDNRIIFVPQKKIDENQLVIDGVTAVEKNGSKYVIYYDRNEEKIVKHLNKLPFFKLEYGESDLEEFFLKVTGGDDNVN
ncbi:MAG: ABC transporter ATP-binding protein [Bacillota bacterium]